MRSNRFGPIKRLDSLNPRVISLERRSDRQEKVASDLLSVGIENFTFTAAVDGQLEYGWLGALAGKRGCAESHSLLLESSLSLQMPLLVLEDDIVFHCTRTELLSVINAFLGDPTLDVLCLHYESDRTWEVSDLLSVGFAVVSTAAYVVKPRAIQTLIRDFRRSARELENHRNFPIDHAWWHSQGTSLLFALPTKKVSFQAMGYSDITRCDVPAK